MNRAQEDYLEAILVIQLRKGLARQVDIAEEMHVSKPSVCNAMKKLERLGLVTQDKYAAPRLTQAGRELAVAIYERRRLFTELLLALGVSQQKAAEDACRLEHAVSDESFQAIKRGLLRGGAPLAGAVFLRL